MADASLIQQTSLGRLTKRSDLMFAVLMMGILAILVLPLPPMLLSLLLACNLSLAAMVLLVALYTREALDFSTFPSLLLVTTLFRLGLNVASTRLILLEGRGGSVIEAFGGFVVGGNLVVGLVIFIILLVIQMVVITKGAGRISEVAARFTLDAMPGKQMAIDADLNAGLISEKDARERREKIGAEAEFYGAMDGASKFVKGDAVAGLIITIVNLVAGIIIGMSLMGMPFNEAIETFSLLTVGDGLVSQIPSLLIAIGSGMLVTKARSDSNIGTDLPRQFFIQPKAITVAACMVFALGVVPGLPFLPFATIATVMAGIAWFLRDLESEFATAEEQRQEESGKEGAVEQEEKVEDLIAVDRISVEIGYRLIPLVDRERGGQLLDRITALRKQLAREEGLLIPPIRVKDNIQLPPDTYRISIVGDEVGVGTLQVDRLLAIDGGGITTPIQGTPTREPAFGLDAVWIDENRRGEAESLGYAVTDPASVFITHITQLLRKHASRLVNREDVRTMLDSLKNEAPVLVKEVDENVKLGKVQKVLSALLAEQVPVGNIEKILEVIADDPEADAQSLAERVRGRIGPAIVRPHKDSDGKLYAMIFDPATEQRLSQGLNSTQQGGSLGIAPGEASVLMDRIQQTMNDALALGHDPVLLTTVSLRRPMQQITSRFLPDLGVLSYAEIGHAEVEVVGAIDMNAPAQNQPQS